MVTKGEDGYLLSGREEPEADIFLRINWRESNLPTP